MYGEFSKYAMGLTPADKQQAKQHYHTLKQKIGSLPPSGRRLLARIHETILQHDGQPVTRDNIADAIGRSYLVHWERRLLDRICGMEIVTSERVPILPRGGHRYIYRMDEETAYLINMMRKRRK